MSVCEGCYLEYEWKQSDTSVPDECKGCQVVDGKPSNYKPKPQTNADRIRAMSDEELARYMAELIDNIDSQTCCYSNIPDEWLSWLRQPTEVE